MNIAEILDTQELYRLVSEGYISMRSHPDLPLRLFNYSPKAQYERAWVPETLESRGLIIDLDENIVSKGFSKFFNYTEVTPPSFTWTQPPVVLDKLDGSMVQIFNYDGSIMAATRGSFGSDQAIWAAKWIETNLPGYSQPEGVSTIVEAIYPENRIVVPYGRESLVLLGAINLSDNSDIPIWEIDWWPGERAKIYGDLGVIEEVHRFATGNDKSEEEGVVVAWYRPGEPAYRMKIKHPRYVQLHSLITNTSSRKIWQALMDGEGFEGLLDDTPDEFYDWFHGVVDDVRAAKEGWIQEVTQDYETIKHISDRREFAEEAKRMTHTSAMFAMRDGKSIERAAWMAVEPNLTFPFNQLNQN